MRERYHIVMWRLWLVLGRCCKRLGGWFMDLGWGPCQGRAIRHFRLSEYGQQRISEIDAA